MTYNRKYKETASNNKFATASAVGGWNELFQIVSLITNKKKTITVKM